MAVTAVEDMMYPPHDNRDDPCCTQPHCAYIAQSPSAFLTASFRSTFSHKCTTHRIPNLGLANAASSNYPISAQLTNKNQNDQAGNGTDAGQEDEVEDEVINNQWGQHQRRDIKYLNAQLRLVQNYDRQERHFHVFLQQSSNSLLNSSINRFTESTQISNQTDQINRLWILRSRADPTHGELADKEPHPPRCVTLVDRLNPQLLSSTQQWVNGLDRLGNALSPFESHFVDWAMFDAHYQENFPAQMKEGYLVIFEIINANWMQKRAIEGIQNVFSEHGKKMVSNNHMKCFEIFQSIEEPTCFKLIEVYENLSQLERYKRDFDAKYEKDVEVFRAAVYRVRQLHECVAVA